MTRKFLETAGEEAVALPIATYDLEIADAHPNPKGANDNGNFTIFTDLKVLNGPDAGRVTSVSVVIPGEEASSGFINMFNLKVAGFGDRIRAVSAQNLDDDDEVLAIAEAIIGAQFSGDLGIQSEGAFAGKQELTKSRPLDGTVTAPVAAVQAAPLLTPEVVAATAVNEVQVTPAPAAPTPQPAPAITEDVPF